MGFLKKKLTGDFIILLIEGSAGYKNANRHMVVLEDKSIYKIPMIFKQNPSYIRILKENLENKSPRIAEAFSFFRRGGKIRTCDLLVPNQAR
jgi:hypothetical protein